MRYIDNITNQKFNNMGALLSYLVGGKNFFLPSIFISATFATLTDYVQANAPDDVFGFTWKLLLFALGFSVWNFKTGFQASIARAKRDGTFVSKRQLFDYDKAWKFLGRMFGFILVIGFLHYFGEQMILFGYSEFWVSSISYVKTFFFFFVCMIELKSVGDNNEVRFGEKGTVFALLDKLVDAFKRGAVKKVEQTLNIEKNESNDQ